MRSVEFHPEAEDEFISAAQFYESQTEGLGLDFILTVQGRPFGRRLRRLLVPKFPYGLLYRVEPDRIYIVAVMHLRRRPGYWRSRLWDDAAQLGAPADRVLAVFAPARWALAVEEEATPVVSETTSGLLAEVVTEHVFN